MGRWAGRPTGRLLVQLVQDFLQGLVSLEEFRLAELEQLERPGGALLQLVDFLFVVLQFGDDFLQLGYRLGIGEFGILGHIGIYFVFEGSMFSTRLVTEPSTNRVSRVAPGATSAMLLTTRPWCRVRL